MKFTLQHIAKLKETGKIRDYSLSEKKEEKRNKYGARKIEHGGVTYDSKTEYNNHMDLLFLQRIGEISNLRRQVVYDLGVCKYIADHVYTDKSGTEIVCDSKSKYTRKLPVYRLKKKLMKERLNIEIREIDNNGFITKRA